jgi:hypothetical protein
LEAVFENARFLKTGCFLTHYFQEEKMKKSWLVLLSLGLVIAFSASALAVDVKFSGQFYAAGMYLDKTSLKKDTASDGPSTAFYFQRLRLNTTFVVSPSVSLVTRTDIMERAWGAARTMPGTTLDSLSAGTKAENENIVFDYAYASLNFPIGRINVGYISTSTWGTSFGNSEAPVGGIIWYAPLGNWTILVKYNTVTEGSYTANNTGITAADRDSSSYYLAATYRWKGGQAGVLGKYTDNRTNRGLGYKAQTYIVEPYAKIQLGPVYIQAEIDYAWGKQKDSELSGLQDVSMSNLIGFFEATATFGPVYFGGTFAYISGDDPGTTNKVEGGTLSGGADWNPCLIMFNYDRTYWAGNLNGQGTSVNGSPMSNAFFYQGKVGVNPVDKLDIMATVAYAYADKKPTGYASDQYGWEIDVMATYKITTNLSYMLGVGYLMTGDYYKGATTGTSVGNDYIVLNKLTLVF